MQMCEWSDQMKTRIACVTKWSSPSQPLHSLLAGDLEHEDVAFAEGHVEGGLLGLNVSQVHWLVNEE